MELDQIVTALDQRMQTLRDEIATLEAARAALGGSSSGPLPSSPPSVRAARDRRPRGRRRHSSVTPAQLERLLAGAGEVTTTVLIQQTGASRPALLIALKELESDGKVKRAGEKRGTRWSAVGGGAAAGATAATPAQAAATPATSGAAPGATRGDWAGPSGDWEASSLD
jgi:hypothetical protein